MDEIQFPWYIVILCSVWSGAGVAFMAACIKYISVH